MSGPKPNPPSSGHAAFINRTAVFAQSSGALALPLSIASVLKDSHSCPSGVRIYTSVILVCTKPGPIVKVSIKDFLCFSLFASNSLGRPAPSLEQLWPVPPGVSLPPATPGCGYMNRILGINLRAIEASYRYSSSIFRRARLPVSQISFTAASISSYPTK